MNAPSIDVKDMLEAESAIDLTFLTDLFVGRMPASPKNCVVIADTPGRAPHLGLTRTDPTPSNRSNSHQYYYPAVQIQVRNNNYDTGWDLINDIKEALHGRANETWNGSTYTLVECATEPSLLKFDEGNRALFVVNFDMQRKHA